MADSPLFPREHGAYVQLGVALTAGLLLGQGALQAWAQAFLTVVLFLASAPALALVAEPGNRRALKRLALLGTIAFATAFLAWRQASAIQWRSLLAPVLLASALAALAFARREHTTLGELLAAWALSSAAYPVAILGGAAVRPAALLALALAAIQSLGTLTVRSFLASLRRQGDPGLRAIPLGLGLGLAVLALNAPLPSFLALALAPNTAVAAWMLLMPPPPRNMKRIGWMLSVASLAGILPVALILR